jgi:hypothetical protein
MTKLSAFLFMLAFNNFVQEEQKQIREKKMNFRKIALLSIIWILCTGNISIEGLKTTSQ